ncbi:aromatic-L-amino-acid decarboxylase-like [Watersipora subatra]|uniref:aromatic-L-amino-acid decarboxylase-like n=1 Tax=Watersipora subatra TaxID=2589382 RepID=UPI00355B5D44
MDANDFRKAGKEMIDYMADHIEGLAQHPVVPSVKPGFLINQLPNSAPNEGECFDKIMEDVKKLIIPGMTHWQHPDFHAYFPAGNSFPSILGEMLESALGCIGFSWAASPSCTELEIQIMDWLGQAIGLPENFLHSSGTGGGVLQGSASESVLVAMIAARTKAFKKHRLCSGTRLVAYCSNLAHSCVEKAALICNVRLHQLEPGTDYSLDGETLRKAMERDVNDNLIPFFVCATIGTTSVCSFDNMASISSVLTRLALEVWLHVDSAYAGNAFICPEFQHLLLDGIEAVDSLEFNANKWMLTNFDCGCMWVKDRLALENSLCVDPLYLKHDHQHLTTDFRNWGIPLSRRFRALKLWFVIRTYGICGLQKYIREHVRLAKRFTKSLLKDKRFEQIGRTYMGLICFRLRGENGLNERLLSVINSSGQLFMVPANVKDKYVIRFCVCSPKANDREMDRAWSIIANAADRVLADDIIEMTLRPKDLSPADLASNSFSFPSKPLHAAGEDVAGLVKRYLSITERSFFTRA